MDRQETADLRVELEIARGQANAHREVTEEAKREAATARKDALEEIRDVREKAEVLKRELEDVRHDAAQAEARFANIREALEEAKERNEALCEEAAERQREESAEKERLIEEADIARERIYFLEQELYVLQEKQETDTEMLARALGQVGNQRDELSTRLRGEEQRTALLEDEVDGLLQKVEEANKQNCLMKDEITHLRRKIEHDSEEGTQVKLFQARLDDTIRELEQLRKRYEHVENQNRVYRTTIQQLLDAKSVSEERPPSAGNNRGVDHRQSPVTALSSDSPDMTVDHSGRQGQRSSLTRASTISLPSGSLRHLVSGHGQGGAEPVRGRHALWDTHLSTAASSAASQADPGSPRLLPPHAALPMTQSMSSTIPTTGLEEYMTLARELEMQLREYTREKEKLQSEFARIPLNGGAIARRRQADVEARLDEVDRNLASVKLKMRSMHVM